MTLAISYTKIAFNLILALVESSDIVTIKFHESKASFLIYVGRATTVHNHFFFHSYTIHELRNRNIRPFLFVCYLVSSKQPLCFVQGQGEKGEQEHTTKKFAEFHNHPLPLTMIEIGPLHDPVTW